MLHALVRTLVLPLLRLAVWTARQHPWIVPILRWGYDRLPDRLAQRLRFIQVHGRPLQLRHPSTFSEKIHWLMAYDRRPILRQCADKYAVRAYVAERVGSQVLTKLYGVWADPFAIDFDRLPRAFVLKVTHGSGQNILCPDKARLSVPWARTQLAAWLHRSEYWVAREWAYKEIPPRILCEEWLTDAQGQSPTDYKFFCFNGEPRCIQVDMDRFTQHTRDFFDVAWTPFPFTLTYPRSGHTPPRPGCLDNMVAVARRLSQGHPFVRVDLYALAARVMFGEMTWYAGGGLERFSPDIWDWNLGRWLVLPTRGGRVSMASEYNTKDIT